MLHCLVPFLFLAQAGQLSPHLRTGVAELQAGQLEAAAITLGEIVREDPEDGEAWYFLGLTHHNAGELDRAVNAHLLASRLIAKGHPLHAGAHYNMACAFGLQGRGERALRWLHRARNAGFQGLAQAANDEDLKLLRADPRLEALVQAGSLSDPAASSVAVTTVSGTLAGNTGGVALAPDGSIVSADFGGRLHRGPVGGDWEVFAEGFVKAADCTFDDRGRLLQVDHGAAKLWRIDPDGSRSDLGVSGLVAPVGIDTDGEDRIFVTDYRLDAVLEVMSDGSTRTVAERGLLKGPNGIVWAQDLGLFVVNYDDGAVLQVDPDGAGVRFVAEVPGGGNGHVVWTGSELYVTARREHRIYRVTPEGVVGRVVGSGLQGGQDGDALSARFSLPNGIALSADGRTLYVNDKVAGGGARIRAIDLGAYGAR